MYVAIDAYVRVCSDYSKCVIVGFMHAIYKFININKIPLRNMHFRQCSVSVSLSIYCPCMEVESVMTLSPHWIHTVLLSPASMRTNSY